jgi:hypothetical protein
MPRYHFVVHAPDHSHDDPDGMILPGRDAAKEHGHRVVGELKDGGYQPPGGMLHILDATGRVIHSVSF